MGNNTSTSKFGENEKVYLNIDENNVSNFNMLGIYTPDIFEFENDHPLNNIILQLQGYNESFFLNKWTVYDYRYLLKNETYLFCECLHRILMNKSYKNTQKQSEYIIKTLADKIFNFANYDTVPLMKTNEVFEINYMNKLFYGDPDSIIENINKQIFCIIREDKHGDTSTFEKGNVQIVSNLILAYIYNFKFFDIAPETCKKLVGIKFISDKVEFMTIDISTNYILQVINGNTLTERITMYMYKAGRLALNNDRKQIFKYLEIIRQHFLN